MKAARCSCVKQEVTGNRVQVPSGPATVMVKRFSINVTRKTGKTEKKADDPKPGDLPCMCHQTLRGKEWCTINSERDKHRFVLKGLIWAVLVVCTSFFWGFMRSFPEFKYMRISSVNRMRFFCFSGSKQLQDQAENEEYHQHEVRNTAYYGELAACNQEGKFLSIKLTF